MPEHQGIEKGAKIAKKNIFDFLSFWSGLNLLMFQCLWASLTILISEVKEILQIIMG